MLPLIPYNGILRPAILTAFFFLTVAFVSAPKIQRLKGRVVAAFSVYLILLAYLTFLSRSAGVVYRYRLSLFASLRDAFTQDDGSVQMCLSNPEALEGIALNILLFIPMGYLLPLLFPKLRRWQVIVIGFLTTVCIEVGQLITKLGMFDLDDILNNMIGLGIGMVLSRKVKPRKVKRKL